MEKFNAVRKSAGERLLEIRIGIHAGPLVAGVIGTSKFSYDVWGDAVNIAYRLLSSGAPGEINVSAEVYEGAGKEFHCETRGTIETKNRDAVEMYFVRRKKNGDS